MINKNKITITLDLDILKILNKLSDDESINKSKFINKIIKEYLKNNNLYVTNK